MKRELLPEMCLHVHPTEVLVVLLHNGERGYYPTDIMVDSREQALETAVACNRLRGITAVQMNCMMFGSLFGFECPGADPEHGLPVDARIAAEYQKQAAMVV